MRTLRLAALVILVSTLALTSLLFHVARADPVIDVTLLIGGAILAAIIPFDATTPSARDRVFVAFALHGGLMLITVLAAYHTGLHDALIAPLLALAGISIACSIVALRRRRLRPRRNDWKTHYQE